MPTTPNQRLLRNGECLYVTWNNEAYDTLFNGQRNDDLRGHETFNNAPVLEDPELDARRQARERRKKRGITLDECLDEFEREEILSEQDTWYCPRCKEHQRASKKFELWKTPDILVMHLKRFSSAGLRRDKLDVEVDFPIQGLDLSSRVLATEEGKNEVYDLFAVDDHWGGLGGGHYTAFAKSFVDGEWYEYNDSSASRQKDTSGIVSRGAYLLFYRRRADTPLGGPRLQKIVEDYDNRMASAGDKSEAESGEGQRLGEGSSPHGLSSALDGAGVGAGLNNSFVGPAHIEGLPAYTKHLQENGSAPVEINDAVMNDGIDFQDEAIDVTHSPAVQHPGVATWNWSSLDTLGARPSYASSNTANESVHSDAVQNASSASADSIKGRHNDFNNADTDDEYEPPAIIPDMDEDAQLESYSLNADLIDHAVGRYSTPHYSLQRTGMGEHIEVVREIDGPSVKSFDESVAAEIHLDNGDDDEGHGV